MESLYLLFGTGAAAGVVSLIGQIIMRKMDKKHGVHQGVCVILYDRIKCLGKRYISEGCITSEELNDLMKMHTIFKKELSGNGFLDALIDQVKKLPIVETKGTAKDKCNNCDAAK